jgi:hypothetical protein
MINAKRIFIIPLFVLSGYLSSAQSHFDVSLLQGAWWSDRNTTMPLFFISGDSLFFTDRQRPNCSVQASNNRITMKSHKTTKALLIAKLTTDSLILYDEAGPDRFLLFKRPGAQQTIEIGDACSMRAKDYRSLADIIILVKYKIPTQANRECVLDIINKLARVPVFRNMEALDIFTSGSDGYVSEKMIEVAMDILDDDPEGIIIHVAGHKGTLFNSLIDGLSMKLSSEKTSKDTLNSEIASKLSDDLQKKTLNEIFEKVDAKKF